MNRVRDLRDIPLLFTEGEVEMGAPKKTRAELLDKIIQFIWDYQDKHEGTTPTLEVIGRHVGVAGPGMGYYANILVDEGRINRIGVRPFRATITNHIANTRAIDRWKRLRARLEAADAAEREQIRERQERERAAEQHQSDKEAVFAVAADSVVVDKPSTDRVPERAASAVNWGRQTGPEPQPTSPEAQSIQRFTDTQSRVREVNREVKAMMPRLLKIADERDLVFELISRGYTVCRGR